MSGVALRDQVSQKVHHSKIIFTAAELWCLLQVLFLGDGSVKLGSSGEGLQQHPVGQRSQAALQVQQVGEAAADAGVRVG